MLFAVETDKTLAAIREDLPKACAARRFGVIATIDLKEKMREKGVDYAGDCLIFEVCNPQKAKEVLDAMPEIATALPCRIAAFRTPEGKTRLATIRPGVLLGLFGAEGLEGAAAEVEETLVAIMNEAAQGAAGSA